MKKISGLLGCLLFLAGCSSWEIKARCEKTNWFEYSQGVAFQGKYLEEDEHVRECKGVDRLSSQQIDIGFKLGREKMCTYDEMFKRGKEGMVVFFQFCDGLAMSTMKGRHQDGLKLFCTNENGYPYGKSGRVYEKVCSVDQEKNFLPTYRNGRRDYLNERIKGLRESISNLRDQMRLADQSEQRLSSEYTALPSPKQCRSLMVYNESTKESSQQYVCEESSYISQQRQQLHSELSRVRDVVSGLLRETKARNNDLEYSLNELAKLTVTVVTPATNQSK